jgi:AcrR family transcriptional regulator
MKRPGLTRERIVTAALELADREGLDAVTLRRLALDLGVHVTSLYNHVDTKDAVLDGVVERLMAEAKLPKQEIAWEDWVRRFAAAMRGVAKRHPGAFEALHHRSARGPEAAAANEAALASFRAAGFDVVEAYSAVKATGHAILGLVLEDLAERRGAGSGIDLSALPPERFPHLHAAAVLAPKANSWSYLIEVLIAGFAANRGRSGAGQAKKRP